jgi:hypothetical protein
MKVKSNAILQIKKLYTVDSHAWHFMYDGLEATKKPVVGHLFIIPSNFN